MVRERPQRVGLRFAFDNTTRVTHGQEESFDREESKQEKEVTNFLRGTESGGDIHPLFFRKSPRRTRN